MVVVSGSVVIEGTLNNIIGGFIRAKSLETKEEYNTRDVSFVSLGKF